ARSRAIFSRTACASASCSAFASPLWRFSFGLSAILQVPVWLRDLAQPRRFAQRLVDAVLPARAVCLEMVKDIAIDAQRDLFLGVWQRRRLCRNRFRRLGSCRLERRFGRKPRVARPAAPSVVVHAILLLLFPMLGATPQFFLAAPLGLAG